MKRVGNTIVPRVKWLNDILISKRSAVHADPKKPSRAKEKHSLIKELTNNE